MLANTTVGFKFAQFVLVAIVRFSTLNKHQQQTVISKRQRGYLSKLLQVRPYIKPRYPFMKDSIFCPKRDT